MAAIAPVPPAFSLRLFGPPQVCVGGQPLLPLPSRKAVALLALRPGRPIEREWLAGTLWPEADQPSANLRTVLSELRHALRDHAHRLQSPSRYILLLDLTDADVDVALFDAAIASRRLPALEQLEETLETFDALVREGKIRYYGTSTFASWQMAESLWQARSHGWVEPVSEQAPYNLLDRRIENDRAGFLARHAWGLIPWSPLAGGQLTGRYGAVSPESLPEGSRIARNQMWRQRTNRSAAEVARTFVQIAQEYGLIPAQAATAWTLTNPLVTAPIIGPRTLEQFHELLPAADLLLPPSFLTALDELVPPGTAVADFLNNAGWQVGHLPGLDNDHTGAA